MIDFEKLNQERADRKRFLETDVGKLYVTYQRAAIEYWRNDSNECISDKRLCELDEATRAAEKAFIGRLMADLGII